MATTTFVHRIATMKPLIATVVGVSVVAAVIGRFRVPILDWLFEEPAWRDPAFNDFSRRR